MMMIIFNAEVRGHERPHDCNLAQRQGQEGHHSMGRASTNASTDPSTTESITTCGWQLQRADVHQLRMEG
jgi:hypothetical protein